jgi:hypothetical protein
MNDPQQATSSSRQPEPNKQHGSECPYGCPVCTGIAIFKQTSPDVTTHLVAAAREFVMAAKTFLDSLAEPKESGASEAKIQRIPLD